MAHCLIQGFVLGVLFQLTRLSNNQVFKKGSRRSHKEYGTTENHPLSKGQDFRSWLARNLHFAAFFSDVSFLVGLATIAYFLRGISGSGQTMVHYILAILIATIAFGSFAFYAGQYDWHAFRRNLTRPSPIFGAVIFAFGALLLIGFALKITDTFSRLWIGLWLSGFIAYILISRPILSWYLSRPKQRSLITCRAVIVGAGENAKAVLDHILTYDDLGLEVVAFIDDEEAQIGTSYRGIPVCGPTEGMEQLASGRRADVAIIALPWSAADRISLVAKKLRQWPVHIYIAPDRIGLHYADSAVVRLGGMHMLRLHDRPISEWNAVVKRIEDLCLAIPTLILLSPLLVLVALAIKLESKGSVLFVQERYGFNNNLIPIYKFRSMYVDMTDPNCEQQTVKNDPRITRVGRFIRKTSIDELPQLFNVVLGNMSIVGPRPHAVGTKSGGRLLEEVVDEYASRHRVKPGITGWAQCNGWRGETDTREKIEKRVDHDLYYIENWSVMLDLLILFKTLLLIFGKDENAY